MLIYNPRPSLSGNPQPTQEELEKAAAGFKEAQAGPHQQLQDKAAADVIKELLPHKDGPKVLVAKEVEPTSTKLKSLMTPQVLDAIPKVALAKYLETLVALVLKDKKAKWADVLDFMTRIRMWADLNKMYMLVSGEILADDEIAMQEAMSIAFKAAFVVPADSVSGSGDQVHKMIVSLPAKVGAVLKARYDMQQEQHRHEPFKFPLYEFHALGATVDGAEWSSPVALNPRVAKVVEWTSQDGKQNKKLVYPLASGLSDQDAGGGSITLYGSGSHPLKLTSDPYSAADYMPYDSYEHNGMDKNAAGAWETWLGTFHTLGKTFFGDYSEDRSQGAENSLFKRLEATGETQLLYDIMSAQKQSRISHFDPMFKDIKPKSTAVTPPLQVLSIGDMIAMGLSSDPEWGAASYIQNYTVKDIADYGAEATPGGFIKAYTAFQDKRRANIMAPYGFMSPETKGGQYSQYKAALANLRMAIAQICYGVPPLDWKWTKKGLLLAPTEPDWDAWTEATNLKNPLGNALYAKLTSVFKYSFKGDANLENLTTLYAILIDMLRDSYLGAESPFWSWDPTTGPFLGDLTAGLKLPEPFKFMYKLDGMLSGAIPPAMQAATQATAGLSNDQLAIVGVRSTTKAAILLAMKASEFGLEYLDKAKELVASIKELCVKLYGCNPAPPPEDTPPEKWIAWYEGQLETCKTAPLADSLYGQLSALVALYKETKDKADKGDADALQQLALIAEQIFKLTEQIEQLTGALAALIKNGIDSAGSAQSGALDWVNLSEGFLGKIPGSEVQFDDGSKAPIEQPQEEKQAQKDVKEQNDKIKKEATDLLAYLAANAKFLGDLLKHWNLPADGVLIEILSDSRNAADNDVPDEEPKGNWWWLLLAAGAIWASKHKG